MKDTTNKNKEAPAVVGYRIGICHVCSECAPEWFTDNGASVLDDDSTVTNLILGDTSTELDFYGCEEAGIIASSVTPDALTMPEECDNCCAVMREYEVESPYDEGSTGYVR